MNLPNCSIDVKINREKCQKFTDSFIADEMLDLVGYTGKVYGKRVLENSFGNGVFLEKIVTRYIEFSIMEGFSKLDIQKGLSNDIYGFEVDKKLVDQVVKKLDFIAEQYSIPKVFWSVFCHDALSFSFFISFDFVIGNPPYLNYRCLDAKTRDILRSNYSSCENGKFDYCYAFIEKGLRVLKPKGKMVQLIPANIYKNVFGEKLRSILLPNICEIWEYPQQKIFGETLTTSSVMLLRNGSANKTLMYINKTTNTSQRIKKKYLEKKWIFEKKTNRIHGKRIGDLFNVSISVATQFNKAFLVDESDIVNYSLETALLRKAASPRTLLLKKKEFIIFPYLFYNKKVTRIEEAVFDRDYPNIRDYLYRYYDDLMKRDKDKTALWFEYGRSQALSHIHRHKLVLSTIVTGRPAVYLLDEKTIPYSGIYITEKSSAYSLKNAEEWLLSDSFSEYVKSVGTSVNGRSYRITCDDIKNYVIKA